MSGGVWWALALLLFVAAALLPLRRGQDLLAAAALAALAPALFVLLLPELSAARQLGVWATCSLLLLGIWRQWLVPYRHRRTQLELDRQHAVGEAGIVVRPPRGGQPGVARFEPPLLGCGEWAFVCEREVAAGDLVFVSHAGKNVLTVVRLDS